MTCDVKKTTSIRIALGQASLALLGLHQSAQAEIGFDWFYSDYTEDKQDGNSRYDISTQQMALHGVVQHGIALKLHWLHETMSGASPSYVDRGINDEPILVMSGASIQETRDDIRLDALIPHASSKTGLSIGRSSENDYVANYASIEEQFELNAKHTTLAISASISNDDITPTDSDIYNDRIQQASKDSRSFAASVSQIINRNSVVQLSLAYTKLSGYLSDPYKRVLVDTTVQHDSRPNERNQWVMNARYRLHLHNNTLHIDYRLFDDDWDVRSQTIESAYYFNLGNDWQLVPSFRYYNQSHAYFYAPFYYGTRDDNFYSSDYRLSPYGALSYQLKTKKSFDTWSLTFSIERYDSDGDYALKKVLIENPGLVDFTVIAAGASAVF